MKRSSVSFIAMLLLVCLLCVTFASCASSKENAEPQSSTGSNETSGSSSAETNVEEKSETAHVDETTNNTEASSETTVDDEETNGSLITGQYSALIENANSLKNGVQAGYTDGSRDYFSVSNSEMKFTYALRSKSDQLVASLKNKNGYSYIDSTMDVFVTMKDGSRYYASGSTTNATANLYRIGMYYYEARFEEQNFFNSPELTVGDPLTGYTINTEASHNMGFKDGNVYVIKDSNDPYTVYKNISFSADDYNLLKIRIRSIVGTKGTGSVYLKAGGLSSFSKEQSNTFTFVADGEYHDVYVPLYNMTSWSGTVSGLRIDVDGSAADSFEIAEIAPARLNITKTTPINMSICRSFYVYTDKMHHNVQFATTSTTKGIANVGMLTKISADRVQAIIVKDKNNTHSTIDGVDWNSVEYVGFDIKDAGIFGYIMPVHDNAGNIKVTLIDGVYHIEQTRTPEGGVINPSEEKSENANDFHLSQRIYTDDSHSFDKFINEAYIERNPIDNYFRVNSTEFTSSSLSGYDPIRGIYVINMDGPGGFNSPYYLHQNRYYTSDITMRSPDVRNVYIMAVLGAGSLECSVIIDKYNKLLPIPVAVCKNFSEAGGERNLYNIDDPDYSEAFFPVSLKPNDKYEITLVNIYQNWGQYPLKQISSIQFRAPYYHLSTGVTESNCILPWYETRREGYLNTLPDFRAMSAPLWEAQPQRNSGGAHTWLEYTDADGNYSATENYADYIDSYGPTYADVTMHNLSYDGRIKATYTHMEMPQTDENRTYYEIKYEVLKDISIKDFKNDFTFYTVTDNEPAATADYRKLGYLNSNNECTVTDNNLTEGTVKEYVLGTYYPYFSMFDMPADASPDGYTNVACLIHSSEFIIEGKKNDANFVILNSYNKVRLSLDLGEVTLKAGDSFTINAILMPWGSHESDYTDGDVNVRNVRKNTLINPLTVTSDTDTVMDSVYLPKIMSNDGKTATFTLKNGYNNIAVRVYGFEKLTVPTLFELIDGNWTKVELSSSASPDKSGYYHYYDGYMVHYDSDGTYSYSFVTNMDTGMERTFKIDLSEDVKSLPASGKQEAPNYLDIYYDPTEIQNLVQSSPIYNPTFSQVVLADDQSYVSLYGNSERAESFFMIKPEMDQISGQYIVVKYRVPSTNTTKFNNFEFYLSTSSEQPVSGENIKYSNLKQDGEWHIVIIDAATFNLPTFSTNDEGKYAIKYIRFDALNTPNLASNNYVDIGFFGMCDTIEEVCDIAKADFETIDFISGTGEYPLITETCTPDIKTYIDPSSGYTKSNIAYYSVVDTFAGDKINACGNSVEGIVVKSDFTTVCPTTVTIGGWAVAEGGIDHFVYSVDNGKTWIKINLTPANVGSSYITHAENKLTTASGKTFKFQQATETQKGGAFQTPKISIDLSAYQGQTVHFTFAAVPSADTSTLCLLTCIEDLTIASTN